MFQVLRRLMSYQYINCAGSTCAKAMSLKTAITVVSVEEALLAGLV